MKKGINPLAALIAAIFLITLGWAVDFHPVAFVFLAIFTGGVLTYDDEEELLYLKRELELKKAIIVENDTLVYELDLAKKGIEFHREYEKVLHTYNDQLIQSYESLKKGQTLDDDFKKLLRIAAIADKRKLGLFDKSELHKILEKYNS